MVSAHTSLCSLWTSGRIRHACSTVRVTSDRLECDETDRNVTWRLLSPPHHLTEPQQRYAGINPPGAPGKHLKCPTSPQQVPTPTTKAKNKAVAFISWKVNILEIRFLPDRMMTSSSRGFVSLVLPTPVKASFLACFSRSMPIFR